MEKEKEGGGRKNLKRRRERRETFDDDPRQKTSSLTHDALSHLSLFSLPHKKILPRSSSAARRSTGAGTSPSRPSGSSTW